VDKFTALAARVTNSAWHDRGVTRARRHESWGAWLVELAPVRDLTAWLLECHRPQGFAVDELIAPLCIGQDATRIGPLMLAVQKSCKSLGAAVRSPESPTVPPRGRQLGEDPVQIL
jgi:hypothetical protein